MAPSAGLEPQSAHGSQQLSPYLLIYFLRRPPRPSESSSAARPLNTHKAKNSHFTCILSVPQQSCSFNLCVRVTHVALSPPVSSALIKGSVRSVRYTRLVCFDRGGRCGVSSRGPGSRQVFGRPVRERRRVSVWSPSFFRGLTESNPGALSSAPRTGRITEVASAFQGVSLQQEMATET